MGCRLQWLLTLSAFPTTTNTHNKQNKIKKTPHISHSHLMSNFCSIHMLALLLLEAAVNTIFLWHFFSPPLSMFPICNLLPKWMKSWRRVHMKKHFVGVLDQERILLHAWKSDMPLLSLLLLLLKKKKKHEETFCGCFGEGLENIWIRHVYFLFVSFVFSSSPVVDNLDGLAPLLCCKSSCWTTRRNLCFLSRIWANIAPLCVSRKIPVMGWWEWGAWEEEEEEEEERVVVLEVHRKCFEEEDDG